MTWLAENWEVVTAATALIVALLNVATRHYSQATGIGRLILFAIDLLSVLVSGGAKPWVKLPMTTSTAPEPDIFAERIEEIKRLRKQRDSK